MADDRELRRSRSDKGSDPGQDVGSKWGIHHGAHMLQPNLCRIQVKFVGRLRQVLCVTEV